MNINQKVPRVSQPDEQQPDEAAVWKEKYARLFADLRKRNQRIGPNDLWIASACLAHDLPTWVQSFFCFKAVDTVSGKTTVDQLPGRLVDHISLLYGSG